MDKVEKVKYLENNENWQKDYGSLFARLPGIADDLKFFNNFINIEIGKLRIIDYGCANGYYLAVLKFINPELDLYGVEIAAEPAKEAEGLIGSGRIFWQSCGGKVPLEDKSVDMIYSFAVIEHVPCNDELVRMFKEAKRILRKDGHFFLRTPNCILPMKIWWSITGRSWMWKRGGYHSNPFTAKRLGKMVRPYFRIERKIYNWGPSVISKFLSKIRFSGQITLILRNK